MFPTLEEAGLELLRAMLQYDPARRISVSRAAARRVSCTLPPKVAAARCGAWRHADAPRWRHAQAKDALHHPYFDDLDRATVDALENPELEGLEDM